MKTLFIILISIFLISCSQEQTKTTHTGETRMSESKILSVTLQEDLSSPVVTAEVVLIDSPDIPEDYVDAELFINDIFISKFVNGVTSYRPQEFGEIKCMVVFTMPDDKVQTLEDTLKLYIETTFIRYNSSENGNTKIAINGENVTLQPDNVTLGSWDFIWMYNIRVAKDKVVKLSYESEVVTDPNKKFGGVKVECHFRLSDYENRFDMYPSPDQAFKHFDVETDKWIAPDITLEHGIHNVYICPNFGADKSRLTVKHESEKVTGTFKAMYKTIAVWP